MVTEMRLAELYKNMLHKANRTQRVRLYEGQQGILNIKKTFAENADAIDVIIQYFEGKNDSGLDDNFFLIYDIQVAPYQLPPCQHPEDSPLYIIDYTIRPKAEIAQTKEITGKKNYCVLNVVTKQMMNAQEFEAFIEESLKLKKKLVNIQEKESNLNANYCFVAAISAIPLSFHENLDRIFFPKKSYIVSFFNERKQNKLKFFPNEDKAIDYIMKLKGASVVMENIFVEENKSAKYELFGAYQEASEFLKNNNDGGCLYILTVACSYKEFIEMPLKELQDKAIIIEDFKNKVEIKKKAEFDFSALFRELKQLSATMQSHNNSPKK